MVRILGCTKCMDELRKTNYHQGQKAEAEKLYNRVLWSSKEQLGSDYVYVLRYDDLALVIHGQSVLCGS